VLLIVKLYCSQIRRRSHLAEDCRITTTSYNLTNLLGLHLPLYSYMKFSSVTFGMIMKPLPIYSGRLFRRDGWNRFHVGGLIFAKQSYKQTKKWITQTLPKWIPRRPPLGNVTLTHWTNLDQKMTAFTARCYA